MLTLDNLDINGLLEYNYGKIQCLYIYIYKTISSKNSRFPGVTVGLLCLAFQRFKKLYFHVIITLLFILMNN